MGESTVVCMPNFSSLWLAVSSGAVVLVVVLLWVVKAYVTGFLQRAAERRYDRWSSRGTGLTGRNLGRYRAAIKEKDQRRTLDFLETPTRIDIDEIYVPAQYADSNGLRKDLFVGVRDVDRAIVLGSAGAGKSMFLRYWLHRWAVAPRDFARIPVLVDLHLFQATTDLASLSQLVLEALAQRGCRMSPEALHAGLAAGRFSLLLDGLDEVLQARREEMIAELQRFARQYGMSQIIVTCRDGVYDGRLDTVLGARMRIIGFDEASMRQLLRLWFWARPVSRTASVMRHLSLEERAQHVREQVEIIMSELRASPAMYFLARSPLLLTMMASLHADDPGTGPLLTNSRAEFYQMVIEHMLRRDHAMGRIGHLARFREAHKRRALQRVALAAQSDETEGGDRRAIREATVIEQVGTLLGQLRMSESPQDMLNEIVERSELLLCIDSRNMLYAFPHLSMQEYLAAKELADSPKRLLERYFDDPGRWRETVKLWCGSIDRDCGEVVWPIFIGSPDRPPTIADRLLALECLTEAREIKDDVAAPVVDYFIRLGMPVGWHQAEVYLAAFGAVAMDHRPWGQAALAFLREAALTPGRADRAIAIQALAASRTQRAIQILRDLSRNPQVGTVARQALLGMGEQIIPVLLAGVAEGNVGDVDDIAGIATPGAALALAELLMAGGAVGSRAAWHLASMLRHVDVEEELRRHEVQISHTARWDWAWAPFSDPHAPEFNRLMVRMASLIAGSAESDIPGDVMQVDGRIGLTVLVWQRLDRDAAALDAITTRFAAELRKRIGTRSINSRRLHMLVTVTGGRIGNPWSRPDLDTLLDNAGFRPSERRILLAWDLAVAADAIVTLYGDDQVVTKQDWVTAQEMPPGNPDELGNALKTTLYSAVIFLCVPGLMSMFSAVTGRWAGGWDWAAWLGFGAGTTAALTLGPVMLSPRLPERTISRGSQAIMDILTISVATFTAITMGFGFAIFAHLVGWPIAITIGSTVGLGVAVLGWVYSQRRRAYDNPLRRLLRKSVNPLSWPWR